MGLHIPSTFQRTRIGKLIFPMLPQIMINTRCKYYFTITPLLFPSVISPVVAQRRSLNLVKPNTLMAALLITCVSNIFRIFFLFLYILFNLTIDFMRIEQIQLLVVAMIGPWARQESICRTLSNYPVEITDFCYLRLRSKPWASRRSRLSNRFTNMSRRNTLLVNKLDHIAIINKQTIVQSFISIIRITISETNLRIN